MKNRIKIGLMLGTAGALGWTPAYAQAPAEAQIAPALPQAVAPAQAESTDPASNVGIGDIVVTAQRRAENVQQVPIAVAAFSGAALQEKGVDNVSQLANLTPGVQLSSTSQIFSSPSMLSGFIRGIGQDDFALNFDPGVGTYVDGVYLARTAGSNVDLLDVERIEILKGPQGTLFGRNTIGGAISVVTRKPTDDFSVMGQVSGGRFNRIDVGGVINIPIVEGKLKSSIAFSSKNRNAWQKRIPFPGAAGFASDPSEAFQQIDYTSRTAAGGISEQGVRGKLLWNATNAIDVTLEGDYLNSETSASPSTLLGTRSTVLSPAGTPVDADGNGVPDSTLAGLYNTCISLPESVLGAIGLGGACGPRAGGLPAIAGANADADPTNSRLPIDNRFVTGSLNRGYGTGINFTNTRNFGFTGTVDIDLGGPALKSITAYRNLDTRFGQDLDNSPVVGFEGSFRVKQHQFSEELQLSGKAFNDKLDYLVGAYYFSEGGRESEDVAFPGGLLQIVGNYRFNTKSYALFTHLNYRVNDLIGITLGGRYTKEDKTLVGSQRDLNMLLTKLGTPAFLFPDPTDLSQFYPTGEQKLSFSNVSPRVGIELHPTERIMLYGSFSKGFKSGGWTTRVAAPVPPDPTKPADKQAPSFNPEKADTFEIGFKSQLFDRMLQVNAAAFYTDYKGIQIQIQRGIGASFENAGNARIKGFEVETIFAPSRVFRVSASAGYIDAYYRRINDPSGTITLASRLPRVPKWTATLSPEFNVFLANEGRVTLRADYSYKSTMAADAENTPELFSGNVSLVNASLTYSAPGDDWSLAIGGNNVFNKRYIANGVNQLNGAGLLSAVPNRPSEYYATLRFKF